MDDYATRCMGPVLALLALSAGLAAAPLPATTSTAPAPGPLPPPLTPRSGPEPRINGARVLGVRPGHPLLFTIAATGERPMAFSAIGLPEGVRLDAATGRLSGTLGFSQDRWKEFAGPGHWNDPDMLYVGRRGTGSPSRLTADEQYTHISLWCLLAAPLLLGCDLGKLDDFTLGLLTNDEVLEVNQDPLGKQAGLVHGDGNLQVWAKLMEDGSTAIGLFNLGPAALRSSMPWERLALRTPARARDLWRQRDLDRPAEKLELEVPSHGVMLVRTWRGADGAPSSPPRPR